MRDIAIEVQYADEDIGNNEGKYTYRNGILIGYENREGDEEFAHAVISRTLTDN